MRKSKKDRKGACLFGPADAAPGSRKRAAGGGSQIFVEKRRTEARRLSAGGAGVKKKVDDDDDDEEQESPSPPDKGNIPRPGSTSSASTASAPATPPVNAVAAQREAALREKERLLGKARLGSLGSFAHSTLHAPPPSACRQHLPAPATPCIPAPGCVRADKAPRAGSRVSGSSRPLILVSEECHAASRSGASAPPRGLRICVTPRP